MKEALMIGYGPEKLRKHYQKELSDQGYNVTDKPTLPLTAKNKNAWVFSLVACIHLDYNTVLSTRHAFPSSKVLDTDTNTTYEPWEDEKARLAEDKQKETPAETDKLILDAA